MELKDKIYIRYEKGNIVRTYRGVDFFQHQEGEYTISSNIYYVYNKRRFNDLEALINLIESELNNGIKSKINGKTTKS